MNSTGIIVLAAGSSSRLGNSKQLLLFKGKTLLQHTADEAIEAGAAAVVVVTGANADEVSESIRNKEADIVWNDQWKEGMASGIAAGLRRIISMHKHIDNVIIAVCDQPFISSSLFKQLYQKHMADRKHIVASSYADTIGTPALFNQKYFTALLALTKEEGAKKMLAANRHDVDTISFPMGHIDIDTKYDYDTLLKYLAAELTRY